MLPLLIAAGGAFGVLGAIKAAGSAVTAAVPIGLFKKNKELERSARLGIDQEFEKYKNEKLSKMQKEMGNVLPAPKAEAFTLFKFEAEELPKHLHWMLSQNWVLTESELISLFCMIRNSDMQAGDGPFAVETEELCKKYGVPLDEVVKHARLVGGEIKFDRLVWLSNNRLAEPLIKQKLMGNG